MTSPAAQALFEELNRGDLQRWEPKEAGERIAGRFVRISAARTRHADVTPVMVLELEETTERVEVWLMQLALRERVFKEKPQAGELVALIYDGLTTPRGGGNDYHSYRVLVQRPASTLVDWDAIAVAVKAQELTDSWYRPPRAGDQTEWATIDDYGASGTVSEAAPTAAQPTPPMTASRGDGGETSAASPTIYDPAPNSHARDFAERPAGSSHAPPIENDAKHVMRPCEHCRAPFPHHEPGCVEEIPF